MFHDRQAGGFMQKSLAKKRLARTAALALHRCFFAVMERALIWAIRP